MCASRVSKGIEVNFPSSHREILTRENSISRFKLFIKLMHFIIIIDMKHMVGMLGNRRILE